MTISDPAPAVPERIDDDTLARVVRDVGQVRAELRRVYQGPSSVIDALLVGLVARGHILLEGVPGVAKTTLVKAFAETVAGVFRRVQFTPDLLPSDITGTHVLDMRTNEFVLRRGPIFANVVLGDEINRAPAKTQSALLEAMQEAQVTIEGTTVVLPQPFIVLATQNPVEQEGVYALPEAQLDRFLVKIRMGYPDEADEVMMLAAHGAGAPTVRPVLSVDRVLELSTLAEAVGVSDTIRRYVVRLAQWTREAAPVVLGASPRASLALMRAARARALLSGRDFVNVEDVRALVGVVYAHRLVLTSAALLEGTEPGDLLRAAVRAVPYDPA